MPQNKLNGIYMYEGHSLIGDESFYLQKRSSKGELDVVSEHTGLDWGKVFRLTDKTTGEYCFVFSDESELFSRPYPDLKSTIDGLQFYANTI